MKKIKLFSIYTDETVELKDIFLKSIQDDWDITIYYFGKAGEGGDFGTPSFLKLIKKRLEYQIDAIEKNWNEIIIWSDIDIQFFKRCSNLILNAIDKKDIVYQSECWPQKKINGGFIVIRCNQKTLSLFKSVLEFPLEGYDFFEQSVMNQILSENKLELKWDVLPKQFWAMSHGTTPPDDIVLHHANCTAPTIVNGKRIGSIELKLEQYKKIRRYIIANK